MPLFAHRRLQAMLADLAPYFRSGRERQLVGRLASKRVDQVLPAQMELVLLWGLLHLGKFTLEPKLVGSSRIPDALSETLFGEYPTLVEITAVSNARLSGEDEMRRTANIISEFASRINPSCKNRLFLTFLYRSEYAGTKLVRKRLVDAQFLLTKTLKATLIEWLSGPLNEQSRVRLSTDKTDVVVSWKGYESKVPNYHSPMPTEAQSLEDNPLWEVLESKSDQLRHDSPEKIKCLFLADVGSDLLRKLEESDRLQRSFSGAQIIRHYLDHHPERLDVVCVFSPHRAAPQSFVNRRPITWKVSVFSRPGLDLDLSAVKKMTASLPLPQFEGYQARSLQQQNSAYGMNNRLHAQTLMKLSGNNVTIDISSRALLSLMAGKISHSEFLQLVEMSDPKFPNQFEQRLRAGDVLTQVRFISGGLDNDDDHLSFEFGPDAALNSVRNNKAGDPGK